MMNKRKIEENTKELAVSRRELDLLILEFDSFEINDKKMNTILIKAENLRPKLTEKINECKSFLLNNKAYKFEHTTMDVQEMFGTLRSIEQVYKSFPTSTILTRFKDVQDLFRLCPFPNEAKWRLLYRASVDGFSAKNFHSKCDGHKPTLTLIRENCNNFIFGGFTSAAWSMNEGKRN